MKNRKRKRSLRNGRKDRLKGEWVSQRRRNWLLSSFVFFCLSCYRSGQNADRLHCHASVISFWINLIVVSDCYSCSYFFAMPFGSTTPVNSSCAVLTVIWTTVLYFSELCTRLFSFMLLLSCFLLCIILLYFEWIQFSGLLFDGQWWKVEFGGTCIWYIDVFEIWLANQDDSSNTRKPQRSLR